MPQRPLMSKSLAQLEELYQKPDVDKKTLKALESELNYRQTRAAASLLERVRRSLVKMDSTAPVPMVRLDARTQIQPDRPVQVPPAQPPASKSADYSPGAEKPPVFIVDLTSRSPVPSVAPAAERAPMRGAQADPRQLGPALSTAASTATATPAAAPDSTGKEAAPPATSTPRATSLLAKAYAAQPSAANPEAAAKLLGLAAQSSWERVEAERHKLVSRALAARDLAMAERINAAYIALAASRANINHH